MKKYILFLTLLLTLFGSKVLKAQEYQEPQWKMPLCFEDAIGEKDTLWIGYDPDACSSIYEFDPQFGEVWEKIDTSKFNVYFFQKREPIYPTYQIKTDTVMKTIITRSMPYGEWGWVKGVMPIKLKFDTTFFNSPDLPDYYPVNPPFQRARIDLEFNWGPGQTSPDCLMIDYYPIVALTGYNENLYCTFSDYVIFNNVNEYYISNALSNMNFYLVPGDYSYMSINKPETLSLSFYPNPVLDEFHIKNSSNIEYNYNLLSVTGKKIEYNEIIESNSTTNLNFSSLPIGIYIIQIFNTNHHFTYKIIKNR